MRRGNETNQRSAGKQACFRDTHTTGWPITSVVGSRRFELRVLPQPHSPHPSSRDVGWAVLTTSGEDVSISALDSPRFQGKQAMIRQTWTRSQTIATLPTNHRDPTAKAMGRQRCVHLGGPSL